MSANITLVEELYTSMRSGNFDRFREIVSPDIIWKQCAGFPGGGERQGPDEVIEKVFQGNASRWKNFAFKVQRLMDTGDSAVVLGNYTGEHPTTGKTFDAITTHIYDISEGRIVRFTQVCDTAVMVATQG